MYVRLALAIAVFAFLIYVVGVDELFQTLAALDVLYVLLLLLIAVPMIWVSCLKWRLFIRASGHDVPVLNLMKLYTIGYFFNTFTPSYIGGDVARSVYLGQRLANQKDAFVSTFLERFTGLLAMALLGMCFVFVGSSATKGVEVAILVVGVLACLLGLICFLKPARTIAERFSLSAAKRFAPPAVVSVTEKIFTAMAFAQQTPGLFLKAMLLSLVFHALTVVNTYIAACAVGWDNPSFAGLFVVVPLVLLVGMLPITPSGLGIQEGAFLFFLERIGASSAEAFGVGIVLRAKVLLIAILGGLLWITVKRNDAQKEKVLVESAPSEHKKCEGL